MPKERKSILNEVIRERRSERSYRQQGVEETIIKELIEAARWAPSPHNAQPWRFVVIKDKNKKKLLAELMGKRYRQDMEDDNVAPGVIEDRINCSLKRLSQVPLLILVCMNLEKMDIYPDRKRQRAEKDMAIQAVGAAIQNLLLAAHSLGLGACWMCAPLFCPDVVRAALKLSKRFLPQAVITIGYPDSISPPPPRDTLEHITLWY